MRRGLGFHNRRSPGVAIFSPASLFTGGVQGAWYDPSDSTTLFSDRAGTTPCGTPGGGSVVPVGLMLDKRAAGYSVFFDGTGDNLETPNSAAFQFGTGDFTVEGWIYPTSTPSYGIIAQCANNSTWTSGWSFLQFATRLQIWLNGNLIAQSNLGVITLNTWQHVAATRNGTTVTLWVNGSSVATATNSDNLVPTRAVSIGAETSSFNYPFLGYISNLRVVKGTAVYTGAFTPAGPLSPITGTSLLTCGTIWSGNPAITKNGDARADGLNPFQASPVGNHAIAANDTTARPELSALVNLLNGSATLATQSVTTVATTYTLYFTGSGSITLSGTATGTYTAGSSSVVCTAGTLTLTVSGTVTTADLRPANLGSQLPVYQARTNANTYDAVGFPRYLVANGTSSAMSTPGNVNLSGTDKVTVFAGVRKLSDAAFGMVAEFGNNAPAGSFWVLNGDGAVGPGPQWQFLSTGATTRAYATATATSPISNVFTGIGDINAPLSRLRLNGAQVANTTTTQGGGNYGTYPLFIGARNNASLFLNGNIYSLIVVGSAVSAGQISATEQWVAGKTGITI